MRLSLLDLPWWGCALVTLGMTHVTIASVTIFLHRHQAHRTLTLHPIASHFFRFWLWLTTGMVTKEWAAIHRKHHAHCETSEDPHSPQIYGIRKVLFEGAELYRLESSIPATLEKYGHGTPDDWIERNLYARHTQLGIGLMLGIDIILFGPIGLSMWAVQMIWIPFFAAGVVNGIGHNWGYRNFAPNDASRNVVPWGILIGGEELHNNHHAYASSARLSSKWWEFDIGWMYIRILERLHLAKVCKVASQVRYNTSKTCCDVDTLQAVITHRYDVLAKFAKSLHRTAVEEIHSLRTSTPPEWKDSKVLVSLWLQRGVRTLPEQERTALEQALHSSTVLSTIYAMRQDLTALWSRSTTSKEQLVKQLEDWCRRAEESGIDALREFSRTLRCYDSQLGDME
ncbi:DesA family fatty acid desaturase [Pseudogulbenkiania ferrooxidans]|uniref:Fatty acid desaturase n=1 Tax=Pseudogulbenkiania ferrooxidans 2002 TaxID=279714 RepID=B9Z0K4_9NEIS|nr:fatty acid desaturase [Pseudogulbenkiania ferrooxidans]EEG09610.1 fatty acid desaturase [Pseudogulbenkiania ferrooxidans 2002]